MNLKYRENLINFMDLPFPDCTLDDFRKVCDMMELPFFEVRTDFNPFCEPHKDVSTNVYPNCSAFLGTLPDWLGRNYDYDNDRLMNFYPVCGIEDGFFSLSDSNSHSKYVLTFVCTDFAVLVNTVYFIID